MITVPPVSPVQRGLRGLRGFLLMSLVACASVRERDCRGHDDTTTSQPTTSPGPTTDPTGSGTAGNIDDAEVADLDRAMLDVLRAVYGQAQRSTWKREDGPGSRVFTLEYGLGRAHTRSAADDLQSGLNGRGFAVDRVLDDEAVTTVFAARGGFPVIVTVDVGATNCVVTVERAGP